jgi:hypothetical protein
MKLIACSYFRLNTNIPFGEANVYGSYYWNFRTSSFKQVACLILFNVGTPSLEARNIRLVNIITYIIEESKLISENMSPNVIHC